MYPLIRYATLNDIPTLDKIARQFKRELPFIRLVTLAQAIKNRELFVAETENEIVGFANWHRRKDNQSTLYDLAVKRDYQNQGIGRYLLYAIPTPVQLKCPTDNETANNFYKRAGCVLTNTEHRSPKRDLNIWNLPLLIIHCQGNNKNIPAISRLTGMAYGTRHDDKPQAWPYFIDKNWKKRSAGDWSAYLEKLKQYHPIMAAINDYENPAHQEQMLSEIQDLREVGILRILVCTKFDGAIKDIPQDCIIGISVPSRYAGFLPDPVETIGRQLHLLGGTPQKQKDLIPKYRAFAEVLSTDGSAHTLAAEKGIVYQNGKWTRNTPYNTHPGSWSMYDLIITSAQNITTELKGAMPYKQLPLWTTAKPEKGE